MEMKPPFTRPVKEYSVENYVFEDGKQVLDNKFTLKYNQNHQIFEIYQYDSKIELYEASYYNYNDDQQLKDVTVKVADGEQKKQLLYEYADDKLTQISEIAGDYNTLTKYDDYGNPSEKETYTKENVLISTTVFINLYDQNGRLVEKGDLIQSDFNPGEPNHEMLKRELIYSKDNNILEIREYRLGWCYQDHNDDFGLTGIALYSYMR